MPARSGEIKSRAPASTPTTATQRPTTWSATPSAEPWLICWRIRSDGSHGTIALGVETQRLLDPKVAGDP